MCAASSTSLAGRRARSASRKSASAAGSRPSPLSILAWAATSRMSARPTTLPPLCCPRACSPAGGASAPVGEQRARRGQLLLVDGLAGERSLQDLARLLAELVVDGRGPA